MVDQMNMKKPNIAVTRCDLACEQLLLLSGDELTLMLFGGW
ncbi:MAG: hypothetical protein BMS9Abin05_0975 [Rhodothermia bacterium]|nr:MAG: hypothetical protein BMS9Abin05_0975 [Rhodothermia bacterium]